MHLTNTYATWSKLSFFIIVWKDICKQLKDKIKDKQKAKREKERQQDKYYN